jgi:hypothetical protein
MSYGYAIVKGMVSRTRKGGEAGMTHSRSRTPRLEDQEYIVLDALAGAIEAERGYEPLSATPEWLVDQSIPIVRLDATREELLEVAAQVLADRAWLRRQGWCRDD